MTASISLSTIAERICATKKYDLVARVGQGGFKETFQVLTKEGESLALKLYQAHAQPERPEREIKAMTRCSHPGIAKIYSVDNFKYDSEDYLYIVEEFIGGGTLNDKLRSGVLDIHTVIDLGNQLFGVLEHISTLGLIHRDIKPDNILFRKNSSNIVVTDFGIVRDLNAESLTATFLPNGPGTFGFMAPELMNNIKPMEDWRTDQFSCGIVLSLSCFNIHPYGREINEIVQTIQRYGNTTLEFRDRVTSSGLIALDRMVSAYPVNRYRTIPELITAWNNQGV
jgi:serine/threonine protein kinase